MIFDTHAHYDDPAFAGDVDDIVAHFAEAGIGRAVNVASTRESIPVCLALAAHYPEFYAAAGIHPSECTDMTEEDLAVIRRALALPRTVAVGEIGLDYHWPEPERKAAAEMVCCAAGAGGGRGCSGHHPFARCGCRHHEHDQAAQYPEKRRPSRRRDPLLFLRQGTGGGILPYGLDDRRRGRRDIPECPETEGNGRSHSAGCHCPGNRLSLYGAGTAPRRTELLAVPSAGGEGRGGSQKRYAGRSDRADGAECGKTVPSLKPRGNAVSTNQYERNLKTNGKTLPHGCGGGWRNRHGSIVHPRRDPADS
jgi:hypothetical protein